MIIKHQSCHSEQSEESCLRQTRSFVTLFLRMTVFLWIMAYPAHAKITVDVSEPNLEISTGFTGDTLTLFGTSSFKGDIVILVKGPQRDTVVRRKRDLAGLWIKSTAVMFRDVHGYYNVASSKPIVDITDVDTRRDMRLGINNLTFIPNDDISNNKANRFQEALIQNKQLQGLYALTPNAVEYLNDNLFKTRIQMPPNVPLGDYRIEAFLFQNGRLIDQTSHPFTIEQVGMAAYIHDFANQKPFYYGLSVILIAFIASFLGILLLRRE